MASNSAWPMSFHLQNAQNWTYAQKVKGKQAAQQQQQLAQHQAQAQAQPPQPQQQVLSSNPQTTAPRHTTARLVQLNPSMATAAAQPSLRYTNAAATAYPYNYATTTTSLPQSTATTAAARPTFKAPSYAPNASVPYAAHSRTSPQSQSLAAYGVQSQSQRQQLLGRRVQNNLTSAVSQYYGAHNGMAVSNRNGSNSNVGAFNRTRVRDRFGGSGGNAYPYGGGGGVGVGAAAAAGTATSTTSTAYPMPKPSYSSRPSAAVAAAAPYRPHVAPASMSSRGAGRRPSRGRGGRRQRPRVEQQQVSSADRDVLCWMFENQGRCRYNEKCQWLHLDPETGQYVPTMYIMNSLDSASTPYAQQQHGHGRHKNKHGGDDDDDDDDSKAMTEKEKSRDGDDDADGDDDEDAKVMAEKFKALMAKTIEKNLAVAAEATTTTTTTSPDKDEDNKEERSSKKSETQNDGKNETTTTTTTTTTTNANRKYGDYKTTNDKFRVCWEFNMFVGCRKGDACKWAHEYLETIAQHPYTGEKLNGLAVKKFRQNNNM